MGEEKNQIYLWLLAALALMVFTGSVLYFNKDTTIKQPANIGNRTGQSRIYSVFYTSGVFSPTNLQINVGDTVRFSNESILSVRIKADEDSNLPGFDSISEIPPQGAFSYTFTERGIFDYHNERKQEQKGTIIVK